MDCVTDRRAIWCRHIVSLGIWVNSFSGYFMDYNLCILTIRFDINGDESFEIGGYSYEEWYIILTLVLDRV